MSKARHRCHISPKVLLLGAVWRKNVAHKLVTRFGVKQILLRRFEFWFYNQFYFMMTCRLPSGKNLKIMLRKKALCREKKKKKNNLKNRFHSGLVRLSRASNIFTKQVASDDEPNKSHWIHHITKAFHVPFSSHSMRVEPTRKNFDIPKWWYLYLLVWIERISM